MLHSYTPVSQLTPAEMSELRQQAPLSEGKRPVHLSSGRVVAAHEALAFCPVPQSRQQLFG